ncbi:MAG: alpha/beta hydrolase [bacterium]
MKYIIFITIVIVSFALLIRLFENKFIFFPFKYPQGYWHPEVFGLQVEDCYFRTADGCQLHGWFFPKDSALATFLWCHGNAGNITDRLDNLAKLSKLPINVFIFDYRGYGRSEGSPNETGIYLDAEAAYDYLISRKDVEPDKIILFGRSLGGAVALDLATKRACAGLILESTFTSAKDMAKSAFGFIPAHLIIKSKFDSIEKISKIQVPILFLHGTSDRTVPFKLGRRLHEAANNPKEFYQIQGADHNDTYIVGGQPYFNQLLEFSRQTLRSKNLK